MDSAPMPRMQNRWIRLFLALILGATVLLFAFSLAAGHWQSGALFLPVLSLLSFALLLIERFRRLSTRLEIFETELAPARSRAPPA
jgi:membrane protein YdbS with pleckstrin-like domain